MPHQTPVPRAAPAPRTAPVPLAALVLALALLALGACRGPRAEVLDSPIVGELEEGMARGEERMDHSQLTALLARHVDAEEGLVDYAGLQQERAKLTAYLAEVARADLRRLGRTEQLALLINAYNACTLGLVLEHYPGLTSIRDIRDPWGAPRCEVGGRTLSLDDIEHGLIRPLYRDARIHFAVNCAARDCPPLAPWAFEGARLEAQLEEVTRKALQNPRYARVDGGKLWVTRLMQWYGEDFVSAGWQASAPTLAAFVRPYASGEVREFLESRGDSAPVEFLSYDWSLNGQ